MKEFFPLKLELDEGGGDCPDHKWPAPKGPKLPSPISNTELLPIRMDEEHGDPVELPRRHLPYTPIPDSPRKRKGISWPPEIPGRHKNLAEIINVDSEGVSIIEFAANLPFARKERPIGKPYEPQPDPFNIIMQSAA